MDGDFAALWDNLKSGFESVTSFVKSAFEKLPALIWLVP